MTGGAAMRAVAVVAGDHRLDGERRVDQRFGNGRPPSGAAQRNRVAAPRMMAWLAVVPTHARWQRAT